MKITEFYESKGITRVVREKAESNSLPKNSELEDDAVEWREFSVRE